LRSVSAVVLAPMALGLVWLGGSAWSVLVTIIAAGVACEWVGLCGAAVRAPPGFGVPLAVTLVGAVASDRASVAALLLLLAGAAAVRATAWGVRRPGSLAAGVLYVGLPCIALIWLRQDAVAGRPNLLFLVLVVWASDVGAYLFGRAVGGPRLAPRISPGKTWAGAAGGVLTAVAIGYGAANPLGGLAGGDGSAWRIVVVAALLSVAAQAGDLLESGLKRRFGVKDSGWLIPGHGGLLDRLDGFLAAGPAAALLAMALGPGVVLWQQ
jgi:phosphatidate cytidylyltransferase